MPECRKIFEAEDSDFGGWGLGAMEVGSSTEMGASGASHLGTGDRGAKTDRSRPRSVPVNGQPGSYAQDGLSKTLARSQTSNQSTSSSHIVEGQVSNCAFPTDVEQ